MQCFLKIKIEYELINNETWEIISSTGWYEHQIVGYDSTNEAWLSHHDIFFDPEKNIVNQIREKWQINVDQFINSVHGWLELALEELHNLKKLLDDYEPSLSNYPKKYLHSQLVIKNMIPKEVTEMAWLKVWTTYTSIANNIKKKLAVEKAIETYLLRKLFREGVIHPYLYVDNLEGTQKDMLKWRKIKLAESKYSMDFDIDQHVEKLLSDNEEYKRFHRICGGGSGNLTKILTNATLSRKWYIGIVYQEWDKTKIVYIKVAKMANILYHSSTYWSDTWIKVVSLKDRLQELLESNWDVVVS